MARYQPITRDRDTTVTTRLLQDEDYSRDTRSCVYKCVLIGLTIAIAGGMLVTGIYFTARNSGGHQGNCVLQPEHCDDWSPWSECSVTCGTGVQTRTRPCYGNSTHPWEIEFTDSLLCSEPICIGEWLEWGSWSTCDKSCGCGLQSRERTCSKEYCGLDNTDHEACRIAECSGYSRKPLSGSFIFLMVLASRMTMQLL